MDQQETKYQLIEKCRTRLSESTENLKAAMDDLQQQSNEYGLPKDRYDSFRSQLLRRKDMLGQQLAKELEELSILDRIDLKKKYDTVQFGAAVITEDGKYFIAVSLGKIEVGADSYYSVSVQVPIYQTLAGKKKGDIVEFRGKKMAIIDVF